MIINGVPEVMGQDKPIITRNFAAYHILTSTEDSRVIHVIFIYFWNGTNCIFEAWNFNVKATEGHQMLTYQVTIIVNFVIVT